MERKTHRDSWTSDESVKERFAIAPEHVAKLLDGTFDPAEAATTLSAKELQLLDEVRRLISAKGLVPTVRSQCHRTAFQLSHTNAVRASIDTNLCLISEVQGEDPLEAAKEPRWYRDASKNIPRNEITRFPFAVLELKLAMDETDDLPDWLRPLVDSDALAPVHKFSKFIHGCAVLLPDEVQAMPYWIDDPALRDSIKATNSTLLKAEDQVGYTQTEAGRIEAWTNPSQQWARPDLLGPTRQVPQRETCFGRDTDVRGGMQKPLVRQKLEPKLIFATERTFVHWLHASVVFLTFGAGAMAVADGAAGTAAERSRAWVVALVLSAGSIAINVFALYNYKWRLGRIRSREPVEWGDPRGPAVLGSILIALLSLSLVLNTRRLMAGEI